MATQKPTFTLVITDFGIPKVIGGSFNVLATDVFKLVPTLDAALGS
jgi:ABC-type Fe3+ transport system permease subunit